MKIFFKELDSIIQKFKIDGVSEVRTIAFIYQFAFKLLESSKLLRPPILYSYTSISLPNNVVEKYKDEVESIAILLIKTIKEQDAFDDLMTLYIEQSNVSNKQLAQYFTPQDISDVVSNINLIDISIDKFEEDKYFKVADATGCGSGSMILSLLRAMKNIEGFEDKHYQSVSVHLVDIDDSLHRIAFFQILLNSLLHLKPLGRIDSECKDVISEYFKKVDSLLFISNMQKDSLAY